MEPQAGEKSRLLPRDSALPVLLCHPLKFIVQYRLALIVLWAGASADLWTTLLNIEKYDPGIEVNMPQRMLSEIFGVSVGVPLGKIIQVAFVVVVASWWRPWCRTLLVICGMLYAAAAISNHFLLF